MGIADSLIAQPLEGTRVQFHGIKGELARRIQNWLGHGRQRVAVEGCVSEWRAVTSSSGMSAGIFAVCNIYK